MSLLASVRRFIVFSHWTSANMSTSARKVAASKAVASDPVTSVGDPPGESIVSALTEFKYEPEATVSRKRSRAAVKKQEQPVSSDEKDPESVYDVATASITPTVIPTVAIASPMKTAKGIPHPKWREQLDNIVKMREKRDAPVDSMGCERCSDTEAPPRIQRFQTLVSLMLSSQTKDQITHAATKRLLTIGFTPEIIAVTPVEKLSEVIYPVGFYRRKAEYIKAAAQTILDEYAGDIPDTVEKLCKLKGVGPKMAYIAMHAAWNKPVGIGVDTHVHRISNRLRWVKTETPEQTREALQSWMPEELWPSINILLVGFGQQTCQPVRPLCDGCLNQSICPVGQGLQSATTSPKRKDLDW